MSRRGAVKVNPVTGKMQAADPVDPTKHRDGSLLISEKYVNAAKDLGLGGGAGMYSHIKSLGKVGGGDIPTGTSIESADAVKARDAALLERDRAAVDVTNTEAVKDAIRTTMKTVGVARVAGFGPTSTAATSGVHQHGDAFHRRKGVVNTMSGAKDISRAEVTVALPPRGPGGRAPGAHVAGMSSLDAHAAEGKAKREAAAAKSAAAAALSRGDLGGGSAAAAPAHAGAGTGRTPATIAGFNKNGGVSVAGGPAKRTGGGGGATVSQALAAAGKGGGGSAAAPTEPSHRPVHLGSLGGHGKIGATPAAAATAAAAAAPSSARSAAAAAGASSGGASSSRSAPGSAAAAGAGGGDAASRAAFFKAQFADKAARTAAAVEHLKGGET